MRVTLRYFVELDIVEWDPSGCNQCVKFHITTLSQLITNQCQLIIIQSQCQLIQCQLIPSQLIPSQLIQC